MADKSAQADIRGIDIDKLAKGYADEDFIFKRFCTITPTSAREIRWYQKTSGILTATTTTGITANNIANTAHGALPVASEQSWTRQTNYVRKYFVESPVLTDEDIKDSDPDILATNIRDLVRAVASQVDTRIINVITESYAGTSSTTSNAVGGGWAETNANPIIDIMSGSQAIRSNHYNPMGGKMLMNSLQHKDLLNYLITTKGSSIPAFASEKVKDGVVMHLLGWDIIVSENVTATNVVMLVDKVACTWKNFEPLTTATIKDEGIGTKIRVWEEGEGLLTDPKAVFLLKSA